MDRTDSMDRWIWLRFSDSVCWVMGLLRDCRQPAGRMSPKVTACQQRAWAGRNGDVDYLWIPLPAAIGVDYRKHGYGSVYYASIMLLRILFVPGKSEYYKYIRLCLLHSAE